MVFTEVGRCKSWYVRDYAHADYINLFRSSAGMRGTQKDEESLLDALLNSVIYPALGVISLESKVDTYCILLN